MISLEFPFFAFFLAVQYRVNFFINVENTNQVLKIQRQYLSICLFVCDIIDSILYERFTDESSYLLRQFQVSQELLYNQVREVNKSTDLIQLFCSLLLQTLQVNADIGLKMHNCFEYVVDSTYEHTNCLRTKSEKIVFDFFELDS